MTAAARASAGHHSALSEVAPPFDLAPATSDDPLKFRDRPVVAVLRDADGAVLDAARNTNGTHRLRHAEVNLVQRWQARGHSTFPAGARVDVSLQCCRMCAALLVQMAPHGVEVRYGRPETGPMGHSTELQRLGWEAPL